MTAADGATDSRLVDLMPADWASVLGPIEIDALNALDGYLAWERTERPPRTTASSVA